MASDATALAAAYVLSAVLAHRAPDASQVALAAGVLLALLVGLWACDLYGPTALGETPTGRELGRALVVIGLGVWLWFGLAHLIGMAPSLAEAYLLWILALGLIVAGRMLVRRLAHAGRDHLENIVVLGTGALALRVADKLERQPRYGVRVLGLVGAGPKQPAAEGRPALLCSPSELPGLIEPLRIDRAVAAFPGAADDQWLDTVASLRRARVSVEVVPELFQELGPGAAVHGFEELPLIRLAPARRSAGALAVKRGLDVAIAVGALLLLAPCFAFIAWRVKRTSPGPVFFRQVRLGRDMRQFTVLKFRTMWVGTSSEPHREYVRSLAEAGARPAAGDLYKLAREDAVTPSGRWLRRTSLDELPQLINVLRGEMSIVGPRPCLPHEVAVLKPHHFERFALPAGITGLWQVTARARATFSEALDFDVAYVRSWSLGLDLRIIARTPLELVRDRRTA